MQLPQSQPQFFRQKPLKTHPMWRPRRASHRRLNPRSHPPSVQRQALPPNPPPRAHSPLLLPPNPVQPRAQQSRPLPPRSPLSRPRPNRLVKKGHHHPQLLSTLNCSKRTRLMRVRLSRCRLRILCPEMRRLRNLSRKIQRWLRRIGIRLRFLEGMLHRQRQVPASPQASTLRKSKRSQIKLNWWISCDSRLNCRI